MNKSNIKNYEVHMIERIIDTNLESEIRAWLK